jgi:hypothetical protein
LSSPASRRKSGKGARTRATQAERRACLENETGLDKNHSLNGLYARWFNDRYERTGHLFERRFGAKPVEGDRQLFNTAEYVFDNPVRAGLCASRQEWPWLGGTFWRLTAAA